MIASLWYPCVPAVLESSEDISPHWEIHSGQAKFIYFFLNKCSSQSSNFPFILISDISLNYFLSITLLSSHFFPSRFFYIFILSFSLCSSSCPRLFFSLLFVMHWTDARGTKHKREWKCTSEKRHLSSPGPLWQPAVNQGGMFNTNVWESWGVIVWPQLLTLYQYICIFMLHLANWEVIGEMVKCCLICFNPSWSHVTAVCCVSNWTWYSRIVRQSIGLGKKVSYLMAFKEWSDYSY